MKNTLNRNRPSTRRILGPAAFLGVVALLAHGWSVVGEDNPKWFVLLGEPGPSISFPAYSQDGKLLAASAEREIQLWDPAARKVVRTIKNAWGQTLAFSPDGKVLAAAAGSDRTDAGRQPFGFVRLYDVASGKPIAMFEQVHKDDIPSLAFSPDGKLLASASWDKTIRLWDVENRKAVATLTDHTGRVWSVAFSPDGKTLASGSADMTLKLWSVAERKCVDTITAKGRIYGVAFSPNGRTLAAGTGESTSILGDEKGTFSIAAHRIKFWDVATRKTTAELKYPSPIYSIAFSPDGKTLASIDEDWQLSLWNLPDQKLRWELVGRYSGTPVFSPDGKTLACGGVPKEKTLYEPSRIVLWNLSALEKAKQ